MNISGPLPISGVNAQPEQELELRPFQQVRAQVLAVNGMTAILIIEGYPVIAQLDSKDQAAALLPQETAQFIVTQRTPRKITLKMVDVDQPQANLARPVSPGPELALRLVEQQRIPVTANHLIIARALLKNHLPVTFDLVTELSETLSTFGSWNVHEADLASALKSAGLPLTPKSLELASRQSSQIGDSLNRLIAKLTAMKKEDLPNESVKQLASNMQMLNSLILKMDNEPSRLAEQLKAVAQILGRSFESIVLKQLQDTEPFHSNNLLSLVELQQSLKRVGKNELANAIGDFLNDVQWNQFFNTKLDTLPGQSDWFEMGFTVQCPGNKLGEKFSPARLRIAREAGSGSHKINPAYTRLILQVDLSPGQTVEVDLSIVDKLIRTAVMAPDAHWCQEAGEELPALEQALGDMGFTLKEVKIDVAEPKAFEHVRTSDSVSPMTVNIEV